MRADKARVTQQESHGSLAEVLLNGSFRQPSAVDAQLATANFVDEAVRDFRSRMDSIEAKLDELLAKSESATHTKEWYSPEEFGQLVGKTRYTVSEWCRLERINAQKAESGRGRNREWRISHEELKRYEREGLFPVKYPGM